MACCPICLSHWGPRLFVPQGIYERKQTGGLESCTGGLEQLWTSNKFTVLIYWLFIHFIQYESLLVLSDPFRIFMYSVHQQGGWDRGSSKMLKWRSNGEKKDKKTLKCLWKIKTGCTSIENECLQVVSCNNNQQISSLRRVKVWTHEFKARYRGMKVSKWHDPWGHQNHLALVRAAAPYYVYELAHSRRHDTPSCVMSRSKQPDCEALNLATRIRN